MKKVHLLSGIIVLGIVSSVNAKTLPKQKKGQLSIQEVQRRKLNRQKELARKPVYAMLDTLVMTQHTMYNAAEETEYDWWTSKQEIDWPAVFHILDSMKNVISVNEYRTPEPEQESLLWLAVTQNNLLAAKTLLEKYKANPNNEDYTPLMGACAYGYIEMINLLLKHGADARKTNSEGRTSIDAAINNGQPGALKAIAQHYNNDPEILKNLPLAEMNSYNNSLDINI